MDLHFMFEIIYEVWSNDTFANETFLVRSYNDRKAAYDKVKELKKSAMSQCESLRDTYWVVEATPEFIAERREREMERERELNRSSFFSFDRLKGLMSRLFKQLAVVVENDEKGLWKEELASIDERNMSDDDCYNSVLFRYYRCNDSDRRIIMLEIKFKDGGYSSISCLCGTPQEIKRLISLKSTRERLLEMFDERVHHFYYDE